MNSHFAARHKQQKQHTHTSFSGDIMEKDCAPINHGNELETDADQDPTGPVGNNLLPRLPACLPASLSLSLSLSFYPSDCMIYLSLFGFSLSFFYSIPLS